MKRTAPLLVLVAALGCNTTNSDSGTADFSPDPPSVIGTDERPASVAIPRDYDPAVTYPLLIVLHGRGAVGQTQAAYFQLFDLVDEKQFVMIYPDGGTFNDEGSASGTVPSAVLSPAIPSTTSDI